MLRLCVSRVCRTLVSPQWLVNPSTHALVTLNSTAPGQRNETNNFYIWWWCPMHIGALLSVGKLRLVLRWFAVSWSYLRPYFKASWLLSSLVVNYSHIYFRFRFQTTLLLFRWYNTLLDCGQRVFFAILLTSQSKNYTSFIMSISNEQTSILPTMLIQQVARSDRPPSQNFDDRSKTSDFDDMGKACAVDRHPLTKYFRL